MKTIYIGDPENTNVIPTAWHNFCMHCVAIAQHDRSLCFEMVLETLLNDFDATLVVYHIRRGYQVRFKTESGFSLFALKWT